MLTKKQRHNLILEMINNNVIERQEDIAARLHSAGINVTQATVSRDIHDLKLIKQTVGGVVRYAQTAASIDEDFNRKLADIFSHSVLNVDFAKNIVVIKTLSGMAHAAASAVDTLQSRYIVGCIAGDDTIMVVMRTDEDAVTMAKKLEKSLKN